MQPLLLVRHHQSVVRVRLCPDSSTAIRTWSSTAAASKGWRWQKCYAVFVTVGDAYCCDLVTGGQNAVDYELVQGRLMMSDSGCGTIKMYISTCQIKIGLSYINQL